MYVFVNYVSVFIFTNEKQVSKPFLFTKQVSRQPFMHEFDSLNATKYTLPTAEIISGKNARAWVSMVLYFKK